MISPILHQNYQWALSSLDYHLTGQRRSSLLWTLSMGAANEIKRLLIGFFLFVSVQTHRLSVFTTISNNVWPIPSVRRMSLLQVYGSGGFWFSERAGWSNYRWPQGQDGKCAAQTMEFERAAEYRDLIQAIGTLRTKQRVMAKDLQNRDVFGYYVDKDGCVFRFSLFVRAS